MTGSGSTPVIRLNHSGIRPGRAGNHPKLSVPLADVKDSNAATTDIPILLSYFDCRPKLTPKRQSINGRLNLLPDSGIQVNNANDNLGFGVVNGRWKTKCLAQLVVPGIRPTLGPRTYS
jgi:hypothetical protein